jgi:hypothetical protein
MMKSSCLSALIFILIIATNTFADSVDQQKLDTLFQSGQSFVEGQNDQANTPPDNIAPANIAPAPDANTFKDAADFRKLQEQNQHRLLICTVGVTPIFLFLVLFFIKRSGNFDPEHIIHGSALVLVIQATIFLVVASATNEQLTGGIGVLGAIAGYLFGSSPKRRDFDPRAQNRETTSDFKSSDK